MKDTPRNAMMHAMYSFMRHGVRYKADVDHWRARYEAKLSEAHRRLIERATTYDGIHAQAKRTMEVNERLTEDIVARGLAYYGIEADELNRFVTWQEYNDVADTQDRVHEALQHMWRDWAVEGMHEREAPVDFVTRQLEQLFPAEERENRREGPLRILVPGSGLGRLAHDIAAALPDAEVTANELSAYMRLAYRFVESLTHRDMVKYHPFSDWWAYQPDREALFHAVSLPDTIVNSSATLLVEGDFNKLFVDKAKHFDAVVTFFFIDTAENVMEYYDTISHVLKKGGIWINMGPLLWHNAAVEFSLEDLMDLAEKGYGFEMLDVDPDWGPIRLPGRKARTRTLSYQCYEKALRLHTYPVAYFAARLKGTTEKEKDEL
jgi:carnosine N-methyltransferase